VIVLCNERTAKCTPRCMFSISVSVSQYLRVCVCVCMCVCVCVCVGTVAARTRDIRCPTSPRVTTFILTRVTNLSNGDDDLTTVVTRKFPPRWRIHMFTSTMIAHSAAVVLRQSRPRPRPPSRRIPSQWEIGTYLGPWTTRIAQIP
jgi:hypothetical protein